MLLEQKRFLLVMTMAASAASMLLGGWSDWKDGTDDTVDIASIQSIADSIRDEIERQQYTFDKYDVVSYRQQVVAGLNFEIKLDIGEPDRELQVSVYRHWSGTLSQVESEISTIGKDCPATKVWTECGGCPRICGEPDNLMCPFICIPGCHCPSGWWEDGEKCVETESECSNRQPECPENQEWTDCGTACPKVCGEEEPMFCTYQCVAECQCPSGWWRDGDKCVEHEFECSLPFPEPPTPSCEVYNPCGDNSKCSVWDGRVNCLCDSGYIQSPDGFGCEIPECAPTEVYDECGSFCPNICGEPEPLFCGMACNIGCQCPAGWWKDGDKCVEDESECSSLVEPPNCDERLTGEKDSGYRGCQSLTRSGKTCQAWDQQYPHSHSRTADHYPGAGLEENFCRNPDGEDTIWCYTTDEESRWEYCDPIMITIPVPDACASEPCQNGALCDLPQDEPEEGEFYCLCTNGFEGEFCEIEVSTPPTECPHNQAYTQCGTACPKRCGSAVAELCTMECVVGCQCPAGWWLMPDGSCVEEESGCDAACPANQKFTSCGTACPKICGEPEAYFCNMMCTIGCQCPWGMWQNEDGSCVEEETDCDNYVPPVIPECPENEVWSDCIGCEKMCYGLEEAEACAADCPTGCVCSPDFPFRGEDGACIAACPTMPPIPADFYDYE